MIDRRKLDSTYYLTVENITFASDAIGATVGTGRSATTTWSADDEVVFKGKLKEILVFALMSFSVNGTAILETFDIVPGTEYLDIQNLTANDVITPISLDPSDGENIVLANDLTFLQNMTYNYRLDWSDSRNWRLALKAAPTTKTLYSATIMQLFAWSMQYQNGGSAVNYTLYDFASSEAGSNKGVIWTSLLGNAVELESAHVSLANFLLSA